MCKYEMDPTSIVEDTEQTDGQGETSITPLSTSLKRGYNNEWRLEWLTVYVVPKLLFGPMELPSPLGELKNNIT